MRATSQLRQLLKSGKTLFVPGCYNALSARIARPTSAFRPST